MKINQQYMYLKITVVIVSRVLYLNKYFLNVKFACDYVLLF